MESSSINLEDYETLTLRTKTILAKYIIHFMKHENYSKFISFKNFRVEVNTSSDKSIINKIFYSVNIYSNYFDEKLHRKPNIPIFEQMKNFHCSLKDECNNKLTESELPIKIDLIPFLQFDMIINFECFNFFFYNGKIFHKFVLKPSISKIDDIMDNKYKLFIYYSNLLNKYDCKSIETSLGDFSKIDKFYDIIGHIYAIIPVLKKDNAVEVYKNIPNIFKNKNDGKLKASIIFLTDDESDGDAINIFMNLYRRMNQNYYFILDKNNKVEEVNSLIKMIINLKKFIANQNQLKDANKDKSLDKKLTKEEIHKKVLFSHLFNFINDLGSLNYLFEFSFKMKFYMTLSNNYLLFKREKVESIEVGGNLRTKEYNRIKFLFNNIKDENFICNLNETKTINIDIDFTKEIRCLRCKLKIPNNKECFYCYACKVYYCYQCVKNNLDTKYGKSKFIDPKHNLLFFKSRNKDDFMGIDLYKLGKNSFVQCTNFKYNHSALCDSCHSSSFNGERYICITCHPGLYMTGGYVDYCRKCVEHMMNQDDYGKKIEENVSNIHTNQNFTQNHILLNKHSHERHIYLMLPLEGMNSSYNAY